MTPCFSTKWATSIVFAVWTLALLALAALALQLGAWQRELSVHGPFAAETPARNSLALRVPGGLGDDPEHLTRSDLRLWINGREIGPPHALHETIRAGNAEGFSHWGANVLFSLPQGVKNDAQAVATIRYSVRPPSLTAFALAFFSIALAWLLYPRAALRVPYLILLGLCGVGLALTGSYVVSSLYALANSWALPTTALIRWLPVAQWGARNEPYLGHLLVTLGGFGALLTWLSGRNPQLQKSVVADEMLLRRVLFWSGLPIATCALVLCTSSKWAGILRVGDLDLISIGGLIPFSDASDYVAAAYDQTRIGIWYVTASNRPLAAAFREILLIFGGFSMQVMLILQALVLASATCFAAYSVVRWRGVWAGITFFGFAYTYARTFVPTALTETLGFTWAMLSIPFFIVAFRHHSTKHALTAFALTCLGLMTRMGSMFTLPAVPLWLVWQFGRNATAKARIFIASMCILLGVLGVNALLQGIFGTSEGSTGGNFAYVVCGMTIGTSWNGCPAKLAEEGKSLPNDARARAKQLYSMAEENFRAKPLVFFNRMVDASKAFVREIPDVLWRGYEARVVEPDWVPRSLLTAISFAGLFYAARIAKPPEFAFWLCLWTSITLSAAIVYFDDGTRVLASSQPLIELFFAMGITSPVLASLEMQPRPKMVRYGWAGLLLIISLFFCMPWAVYRFFPANAAVGGELAPTPGEAVVYGGRRMSGFLVVDDGVPLRHDLPTLHLRDFKAIIQQSGVEAYQKLIDPTTPPLPFGFIFAPRLERGVPSLSQFIVPIEVMERHDVPVWRFHLKAWGATAKGYNATWSFVAKAEPWR